MTKIIPTYLHFAGYKSQTAEILTKEGWKKIVPDMPVVIEHHCMVLVNTSTVMMIGGGTPDAAYSNKTYFYNFEFNSWREGPSLILGRKYHACAMVKKDQDSDEVKKNCFICSTTARLG